MFFALLSLLFHGYEPNRINTWPEFYESMEISFTKQNKTSFDLLDVNEIIQREKKSNPSQSVLSIYAFDANNVSNIHALEFILLEGCWVRIPIIENDIPIYSNLESADKTNNFHFVALMLLYEPLPIKYKIEYLVKKVKSKKMRHFVQVLANLRNIVFHRISRGLEPLPDYAPEYYYGLYGDWEFFF